MDMKIDAQGIRNIIPHRYPLLLLDCISEYALGVYAIGHKCVTQTEPVFQGHFPDQPIMPGVFQIEAMAQLCAVLVGLSNEKKGRMFLAGVHNARFSRPVVPGQRMDIRAEYEEGKLNLQKFTCSVTVDGKTVSKALIIGALVNQES